MNVLRKAQEAIDTLQSLIDSGKDDGNLAVVIVHDECSIKIVETEETKLTRPDGARRDNDSDPEGDMLAKFVKSIEFYFGEGAMYGCEFFRPSSTEVEVRISVRGICDYDKRTGMAPDVRMAFYEELPNLIQLYKNAGWKEVFFEGDEDIDTAKRDGTLVFKGKVSSSPYRKLLEGKTPNASEDVKLTSPEEAQA